MQGNFWPFPMNFDDAVFTHSVTPLQTEAYIYFQTDVGDDRHIASMSVHASLIGGSTKARVDPGFEGDGAPLNGGLRRNISLANSAAFGKMTRLVLEQKERS